MTAREQLCECVNLCEWKREKVTSANSIRTPDSTLNSKCNKSVKYVYSSKCIVMRSVRSCLRGELVQERRRVKINTSDMYHHTHFKVLCPSQHAAQFTFQASGSSSNSSNQQKHNINSCNLLLLQTAANHKFLSLFTLVSKLMVWSFVIDASALLFCWTFALHMHVCVHVSCTSPLRPD